MTQSMLRWQLVGTTSFGLGLYTNPQKLQAADDAALYEETQAITQNKQSVVIGDFNCPNIDWTTMNGDQEG